VQAEKMPKVLPVHAMKSYGGNEAQLHSFFTSILDRGEWSESCPSCFTAKENLLVPTEQKAGWCPETVWTYWKGGKSHLCWDSSTRASSP